MSNANLIVRMRDAIEQFQQGQLPAHQLEKQFETCMEGLERIRSVDVHTSRQLIHNLLHAHFWDGEIEFGDPDEARAAADECRQFLDSLPQ